MTMAPQGRNSALKDPELYEELGLSGYSQFTKAQLVDRLRNH